MTASTPSGSGRRVTGGRSDSVRRDMWVAWVERRLDDRSKLAAPSMVALWSLLTFYHLTYGFLILLPLAAHLLLVENPGTQVFRRRLFWSLQLGLMFDVPGWSRRLVPLLSIPGWVDALLSHFDRVLMLGLFAATAALALRAARIAGDQTTSLALTRCRK